MLIIHVLNFSLQFLLQCTLSSYYVEYSFSPTTQHYGMIWGAICVIIQIARTSYINAGGAYDMQVPHM